MALAAGSNDAYQVSAPAGQWIMVGDPSGTEPAHVAGEDHFYGYDPVRGYLTGKLLQLPPGQGVLVESTQGGTITVTPFSGG